MTRIYLSVPHMGGDELSLVREAFDSNWLSTVGPQLEAFEHEFSEHIGLPAVALASGTAAMHLGLRLLGVSQGDEVLCPSLTFVASVNPVSYLGARPVFIDSDRSSWMMSPALLAEAVERKAREGRLPRAVVVVHLYGQCADMDPILEVCRRYEISVLEDAAEALGASYRGRPAGSLGDVGVFSFNGNKIITTTSGGMLAAKRADWVDKARFWSTQAREPGIAYQHTEMGYNYRMSNVLAAIGRGQMRVLGQRVRQRRAVAFRYRDAFADLPGISFMPQAEYGLHTNWLSCFLVDPNAFGTDRDEILRALADKDIEARPVWKPMHLQPLYAECETFGGDVAAEIFHHGMCLPSSSGLSTTDQDEIIGIVRGCCRTPS